MRIKTRSAGVVVTRKARDGWRYLLLRVYRYWDFPKGIVEQGEDALAAACREVREETGIERLEFIWGHRYWETEPYGAGKVARYYLALTAQSRVDLPISAELGRPEHHEFRWVSNGEGMALLGARLRPVLRWAHDLTTEEKAECESCGQFLLLDRSGTADKDRS
jgi:bis(5'-nucleosidyl)-tetraphosphatase